MTSSAPRCLRLESDFSLCSTDTVFAKRYLEYRILAACWHSSVNSAHVEDSLLNTCNTVLYAMYRSACHTKIVLWHRLKHVVAGRLPQPAGALQGASRLFMQLSSLLFSLPCICLLSTRSLSQIRFLNPNGTLCNP